MPDHDAELMLRAARGDESAFRQLFDHHYPRAVNIAYRSLGDMDLAEDVAMDAFANIYESRSSYKPRAKFSTYLYRVVINLCLNAAKRRRTVRQEPLNESTVGASADKDPATQAQRAETSRQVQQAILSLPANQRIALVLTQYDQMSYASAAEAMKVSVKALESLLHRAKRNLRIALADLVPRKSDVQ